jgi:hypothetical protein
MKTLGTIVLSLIAIMASLVLVLSAICAFSGDPINGAQRSDYLIWVIASLAVVAAAMWAIGKLNKKT